MNLAISMEGWRFLRRRDWRPWLRWRDRVTVFRLTRCGAYAEEAMGDFRTFAFGLLGYEPWGRLRPSRLTLPDGREYAPLFGGLWRRVRKGA